MNNIKHVEQTKSAGIHFQAHTACPLHSVAHISKLKLQTITNHLPNHQCRKTHATRSCRGSLVGLHGLGTGLCLGFGLRLKRKDGITSKSTCSNVLQVVRRCCDPLRIKTLKQSKMHYQGMKQDCSHTQTLTKTTGD